MEISRDGHRARMRAAYLQGGGDAMPDHQLLELLLSISLPRKDVKTIAYALINRFGSLEQVFAAGAADLQQVPGVGEQTAVQILLVRDLNRRIHQNQNKPVKNLTDAAQSCAYFANLLRDKTTEQVYLVTLDGSAKILQTHAVGSGSVNLAAVDQRTLMEHILRDNANAVMLAHNHPGGKAQPSAQDLEFTIRLLSILRSIHVQLLDHIIVSPTDTYSMRSDPEYGSFFNVK